MILTIGYEHITPDALRARAEAIRAVVVDCRSSVARTKRGFGRRQLEALLGDGYTYRGDTLGGRGAGVTAEGVAWLRSESRALEGRGRNVLLLGQEGAPGDCNRHHMIAAPHFPDTLHVYDPGEGDDAAEIITTRELVRALRADDVDYARTPWADFLAGQALGPAQVWATLAIEGHAAPVAAAPALVEALRELLLFPRILSLSQRNEWCSPERMNSCFKNLPKRFSSFSKKYSSSRLL
jgi:hypothetical protein